MQKRVLALSLLAVVVVTSGCINDDSQTTESEGNAAITVHDFSVDPTTIYEGSSVRVGLQLANTGNNNATLKAGENGEEVFKNYCPDKFSIDDSDNGFQATPNELEENGEMKLLPEQEVEMQWLLNQDAKVPLYGYDCTLDLEVPFEYSVSAYKQIQLKSDDQVKGSSSLSSESSTGPLKLAIVSIGGTGEEGDDTFVTGEDETVTVHFQLQNHNQEDHAKGLIDIHEESLQIKAEAPFNLDGSFVRRDRTTVPEGCDTSLRTRIPGCAGQAVQSGEQNYYYELTATQCEVGGKNSLQMFEGQSRIITCNLQIPETISSPSEIVEISASVDYTYLKQAGEHTVKVEYRGG